MVWKPCFYRVTLTNNSTKNYEHSQVTNFNKVADNPTPIMLVLAPLSSFHGKNSFIAESAQIKSPSNNAVQGLYCAYLNRQIRHNLKSKYSFQCPQRRKRSTKVNHRVCLVDSFRSHCSFSPSDIRGRDMIVKIMFCFCFSSTSSSDILEPTTS